MATIMVTAASTASPKLTRSRNAYSDAQHPNGLGMSVQRLDLRGVDVEREHQDGQVPGDGSEAPQHREILDVIAAAECLQALPPAQLFELRVAFDESQTEEQEHRAQQQPEGQRYVRRSAPGNDAQCVKAGQRQCIEQQHSLEYEGVCPVSTRNRRPSTAIGVRHARGVRRAFE
jgi:hypothetical protein